MSAKVKRYGKVIVLLVVLLTVLVLAAATITRLPAWSNHSGEADNDPNGQSGDQLTRVLSRDIKEIVAKRDYNHRLWQVVKEFEVVDPDTGRTDTEQIISHIVEVGCGICYQDEKGDFQVTDTCWQETKDGFLMDTAAYELQVGRTVGYWLCYTIDGDDLYLRPAGINAYDGVNIVTVAELDGKVEGAIDPCDSSRLVFAGAFGKGIDLVLQAGPDGYHQDVIFHESLRLPDYMNPEETDIFLYTELSLDDYCQNQDIEVFIGGDEYVDVNEQINTSPTLENIEFTKVVEEGGCLFSRDRFKFIDSKVYDSRVGVGVGANQAIAHKQLFRDEDDKTYLVETLGHSFFREAAYPVVWDYETRSGTLTEDEDWYAMPPIISVPMLP